MLDGMDSHLEPWQLDRIREAIGRADLEEEAVPRASCPKGVFGLQNGEWRRTPFAVVGMQTDVLIVHLVDRAGDFYDNPQRVLGKLFDEIVESLKLAIVVDFDGIRMLSIDAFGFFARLICWAREINLPIASCNVSSEIGSVLSVLKLDSTHCICATREQAVIAVLSGVRDAAQLRERPPDPPNSVVDDSRL